MTENTPAGSAPRRLVLASRSPRRRELLDRAGLAHEVIDTGIDDAELRPAASVAPEWWVASLGYLKARAGAEAWAEKGPDAPAVVLGADTVCVAGDEVLGQPRDAADAARMLARFTGAPHRVLTGVALVWPGTGRRHLLVDAATVRLGTLSEHEITSYLESGAWSGKAGGYNLSERLDAGWPISYDGDPSTVMGLPLRRLSDPLREMMTA